uniref:Uncharacterized protein n=2 Tax=Anguilla anguilla TaxID=7936 RepID=A0A0E9TIG3_ANGAN
MTSFAITGSSFVPSAEMEETQLKNRRKSKLSKLLQSRTVKRNRLCSEGTV